MRILLWQESFWPAIGGAEVFASDLLASLKERGHDLLVVTRKDSSDLPDIDQHRGIPIRRFPFWQALAARDFYEISRLKASVAALKASFSPEIVHLHGIGPSLFFHLGPTIRHRAPLLVTLFSELTHPMADSHLTEKALAAADWVTGVCAHVIGQARRKHPSILHRSSVIYNAIPQPSVIPTPLSMDPPRLLCVGRLSAEKGFDVAVSAFAAVSRQFPAARLRIVGDGPERPSLESLIRKFGLEAKVILSGWVAPREVLPVIDESSLVLIPSRSEAFGIVALQAAWMNRPVVAARAGGLQELIQELGAGLLVSADDPRDVFKAIRSLIENPDQAQQIAYTAREKAAQKFSWEEMIATYDGLYHKMAGQPYR
jgi:glycogen synthase